MPFRTAQFQGLYQKPGRFKTFCQKEPCKKTNQNQNKTRDPAHQSLFIKQQKWMQRSAASTQGFSDEANFSVFDALK